MTATTPEGAAARAKAQLRAERLAARRAVPTMIWQEWDEQRVARVLEQLTDVGTIATYLSMPAGGSRPEPGTLALTEALWRRGQRVLAPVLSPTADGARHEPDWARYEGPDRLRDGLWGIPEPTGPALGAAALAQADVVLCSAMAVTLDGRRLGVGGGWFDRALAFARPDALLVALVTDDDVVDALPTEPHDRTIDVIVTPTRKLHA